MAGPNDVGVLRGIIGDGKSMNDEEMREKVRGKRVESTEPKDFMHAALDKKHLIDNRQSTNINPNNALAYFTGKTQGKNQKNPVDALAYFTGKSNPTQQNPVDRLNYFMGKNQQPKAFNAQSFVHGNYQLNKFNPQSFLHGRKIKKDRYGRNAVDANGVEIMEDYPNVSEINNINNKPEPKPSENVNVVVDEKGFATGETKISPSAKLDVPTDESGYAPYEAVIAGEKAQALGEQAGGVANLFTKAYNGQDDTGKNQPWISASKIGQTIDPKNKSKTIFENAKMVVGAAKTGFFGPEKELTPEEKAQKEYESKVKKAKYASAWNEATGFGRGLTTSQQKGAKVQSFAAGLADNLGSKIASSNMLVGQFEKPESQNVKLAVLALEGFKNTMIKKYTPKEAAKRNLFYTFDQVKGSLNPNERIKLIQLSNGISNAQSQMASGFMSGTGGAAVLRGSRPRDNLMPFTQVGPTFERQQYGSYGPEASSRLGVGQGLRADQSNKWGVLVPSMSSGNESNKIARILGKNPDPTGQGESASAKIKRLAGL